MSAPRRAVYRHTDLERLFNPKSIAIYGISPNPGSFGAKTLANLAHYKGSKLLVNPKYGKIGDLPCHPSVSALPQNPDCVIVALPMEAVEPAVLECAQAGVGSVMVYASGYAEMNEPERIERQRRLAAIARETGLKILGPNCMGFMNFPQLAMASFAAADLKLEVPARPGISVVAQSGAMGFGLAQAVHRGAVISHIIATGNACDINIADVIAWLADEPACSVIACVFEGLADLGHLVQAGEIAWRADKPVIIHKLGTGEGGARAAIAHTGSVTGDIAQYRAACERTGIIMVEDIEALMETASFFSKAPRRPSGRGVAVLSPSGGLGVSAADAAEKHGVALPQPPEPVRKVLEALIPDFGSRRNPADITAAVAGDLKKTAQCFEALAADPAYGALVFPQVLYSSRTTDRYQMFSEVAARHGKPILLPLLGGWIGGPGYVEAEQNRYTTPFLSMDRCFATLAAWFEREQRRSAQSA